MQQSPLFCFGSLMDWDVVNCVLNNETAGLSMVAASLNGYRVTRLPHETYPILVTDAKHMAHGQLLYGLSKEQLDRVIFFEGEEYQISPCEVSLENGDQVVAQFFDEGIMPAAEMTDWCFNTWQQQHKDYLLRQSAVYISYYGKMSAAEADYYWQSYTEEEFNLPLCAAG
jgi:hypothetical protein